MRLVNHALHFSRSLLRDISAYNYVVVANTQVRALRAESWRRVPCEQPLHMGQSILRLTTKRSARRGSPFGCGPLIILAIN